MYTKTQGDSLKMITKLIQTFKKNLEKNAIFPVRSSFFPKRPIFIPSRKFFR